MIAANHVTLNAFSVTDDSLAIDHVLVNGGTGDITDGLLAGEYQSASAATSYTVNANEVVLELAFEFDANVDLDTADLAGILSAAGAADNAGDGITAATIAVTAAEDDFLLIAYQGGDAFIFKVASASTDTAITSVDDTAELVMTLDTITAASLTFNDFIA